MGIVNVTSDSFSDGGRCLEPARAIARGRQLHAAGADIVDVGGQSTRPGARGVDTEIELARVVPVIRELAAAGVPTSVDTMRAAVAAAALEAGVTVINDVSGGRADPDMATVVAQARVPWILMHWRGAETLRHGGEAAHYRDVVAEVRCELGTQIEAALAAGVPEWCVVLDPGLGFAKNARHNWELLAALPEFVAAGYPILVGASRKRFLGRLLGDVENPRAPADLDGATAAISVLAAWHGAWGVRVHDVSASLDALRVTAAWQQTAEASPNSRGETP